MGNIPHIHVLLHTLHWASLHVKLIDCVIHKWCTITWCASRYVSFLKSVCRGRKVSKAILVHEVRKDNPEILDHLVKSALLDHPGRRCVRVTHLQCYLCMHDTRTWDCVFCAYDCRDRRVMPVKMVILETMEWTYVDIFTIVKPLCYAWLIRDFAPWGGEGVGGGGWGGFRHTYYYNVICSHSNMYAC